MEALNREKALVPPVVLTLPKHLRGAGIEQLQALSTKMGHILQALERERRGKAHLFLVFTAVYSISVFFPIIRHISGIPLLTLFICSDELSAERHL